MQWLIDIIAANVISTIGIPPVYIDRGPVGAADWSLVGLTADGAWHTLDASGIVPEAASAMLFQINMSNAGILKFVQLRTDNTHLTYNRRLFGTVVANLIQNQQLIVEPTANRTFDYFLTAVGWNFVEITIQGWFL